MKFVPEQDSAILKAAALFNSDRLDEADRMCRDIAVIDPGNVAALHLRARIALKRGEGATAVTVLTRAVALRPEDSGLRYDLARLHLAGKRSDLARPHLEAAIAVDPGLAAAHLELAVIAYVDGQFGTAETHFRAALDTAPRNVRALFGLLQVLGTQSRVSEAAAIARRIIALRPDDPNGHAGLAVSLDRLGDFDGAAAAHRRAMALSGNAPSFWYGLVLTLAAFGHVAEAIAECRALIATHRDYVRAHIRLARLVETSSDAEVAELERLLDLGTLAPTDRIQILYVLGAIRESREEFAAAFTRYDAANALARQRTPYSAKASETTFAEIKSAFSRETFAVHEGTGCADPTPIFIVGMPRSGTTLVEQILSSHPQIAGAGELDAVQNLFNRLKAQAGAPDPASAIAGASAADLERLGQDYIAEIRSFSANATHVIDKMPANFLHLGLIALVLPKARIIHCRRDALDTGLSIYKTWFPADMIGFSHELADLGHYYRLYEDLMGHWEDVLPQKPLDVSYERLVDDLRGETARLLGALGLDWSDDCERFFDARRPVHTASIAQVRRPIYASSVGRAQSFGAALDPLRRALAGPVKEAAE